MLDERVLKGLLMNKTKELHVLIKASDRACKILALNEKAQPCIWVKDLNAILNNQSINKDVSNDDIQNDHVTQVKKSLIAFINVYRALHDFCGGDTDFMLHWLKVKNKSFGVAPKELLATDENIQQLNQYFDGRDASRN